MSADPESANPQPGRKVHSRDVDATAPGRCACYAAWSELTASPHDLDPRPGLREKLGAWNALPQAGVLDTLVTEFVNTELDVLKRQYSSLFKPRPNQSIYLIIVFGTLAYRINGFINCLQMINNFRI